MIDVCIFKQSNEIVNVKLLLNTEHTEENKI